MTPSDANNDDVADFLATKKKAEVYRSSTDLEILTRERDKIGYVLSLYVALICALSYSIGSHFRSFRIFVPLFPIVAWLLIQRYRRLDDYVVLQITRFRKKDENGA